MKKQNSSSPFKNTTQGKFNRRRFLAAAGVSALGFPFIKPSSVFATTPQCETNGCPDVNNIPSPDPWLIRGFCESVVCCYNDANITVTGARHYCGTNHHPASYPTAPDFASVCFTIYPNVSDLLNGVWDNTLAMLLQNAKPRDMMSCWHELAGGKSDASGHKITASDAVNMQEYIQNFKQTNYSNSSLAIGAIECGNGNPNGGWDFVKPYMRAGLDFYGNDLYHRNYGDPVAALNAWLAGAVTSGYSSNATIAVCECNCASDNEAGRPCYFAQTANWLWNQQNRGARCFLTFWNPTGTESGPWDPNDTNTIAALQKIGNGDYSIPSGC